jgi:hypothetical protein
MILLRIFNSMISTGFHAQIIDVYQLNLSGFIIFLAIIWILQETTKVRILRYVILFIGILLSCHMFTF